MYFSKNNFQQYIFIIKSLTMSHPTDQKFLRPYIWARCIRRNRVLKCLVVCQGPVYRSPIFTWPPLNPLAWNWTQVSHIPGWVLKMLDLSVKQWLPSQLPFVEGVCSSIRLVWEGLSLRREGMPVLGMLRELFYEADLELVGNAKSQAVRLAASLRSTGSVPGNAARREFSCL